MDGCVLAVGYSEEAYGKLQREWMKYGIHTHKEAGLAGAVLALGGHDRYLLVDIFAEDKECLAHIKMLRGLTEAPILVVRSGYDGMEKILAIEAGADEYIPLPDSAGESVASGRALMRRSRVPGPGAMLPATVLSCGDLLLYVEYRRAFVCGKETDFTRQEYDFLCLLLRGMGRVYTHEQICEHVWGDGGDERGSNALWNLVSRLRAKIAGTGGDDRILQTVRDVGYRIDLVQTA